MLLQNRMRDMCSDFYNNLNTIGIAELDTDIREKQSEIGAIKKNTASGTSLAEKKVGETQYEALRKKCGDKNPEGYVAEQKVLYRKLSGVEWSAEAKCEPDSSSITIVNKRCNPFLNALSTFSVALFQKKDIAVLKEHESQCEQELAFLEDWFRRAKLALDNDTQNQNKDVCAIIGKVKLKPPAPAPAPAAVVVAPLTPPAISDEMLLAVVTACFDPTDFRGNQNGEDEGMSEAKAGLPPRKPLDTIPRRSSSLDLFPDSPQTQHLDPSDSDHHANRFDP